MTLKDVRDFFHDALETLLPILLTLMALLVIGILLAALVGGGTALVHTLLTNPEQLKPVPQAVQLDCSRLCRCPAAPACLPAEGPHVP